MSLLKYQDFLNESAINEGFTPNQLIALFSNFRKSLSKQRENELLTFASTNISTELGTGFTGLLNNDNYMTVYDTVIKIRSGQGGKIAEFARGNKNSIEDIFKSLADGKAPSNKFEKAICLVLYIEDNNPEAIMWAPKDSLSKETLALNNINAKLDALKKQHNEVRILLSDKFYQKSKATAVIIDKFDKVDGTPKADFKIVDEEDVPFIFISHKDGKTAKDFQQYGGISDKKIYNHPEVVEFVNKMRSINTDFSELPVGGREFAVLIKDPKLAAMSIFGSELGGSFGLDNVHLIMQGDIILDPIKTDYGEGCYTLSASGHYLLNPALTGNRLSMSEADPYWPVLYVSYRSGQGGTYGFKNARFGIWPSGSDATKRGFKNMENI
jgi:hypothetical protein